MRREKGEKIGKYWIFQLMDYISGHFLYFWMYLFHPIIQAGRDLRKSRVQPLAKTVSAKRSDRTDTGSRVVFNHLNQFLDQSGIFHELKTFKTTIVTSLL